MSETKRSHSVHMDNRNKITVTGLEEVVSSNTSGLVLRTSQGLLTVAGSAINISKLNIEEGVLAADGSFDSLKYSDSSKKRGLANKLFK